MPTRTEKAKSVIDAMRSRLDWCPICPGQSERGCYTPWVFSQHDDMQISRCTLCNYHRVARRVNGFWSLGTGETFEEADDQRI
jgi:hypothetical protein